MIMVVVRDPMCLISVTFMSYCLNLIRSRRLNELNLFSGLEAVGIHFYRQHLHLEKNSKKMNCWRRKNYWTWWVRVKRSCSPFFIYHGDGDGHASINVNDLLCCSHWSNEKDYFFQYFLISFLRPHLHLYRQWNPVLLSYWYFGQLTKFVKGPICQYRKLRLGQVFSRIQTQPPLRLLYLFASTSYYLLLITRVTTSSHCPNCPAHSPEREGFSCSPYSLESASPRALN